MSIEYAVDFSCVPRTKYGERRLRVLGRLASLHGRVVSGAVELGKTPTEESFRFIDNLADEMALVEEIATHCLGCPANLGIGGNSAFEGIGCLGRIHFPIDSAFETFIANRVQLMLDTVAEAEWPRLLLVLADAESPFDGEVTKHLRHVTTKEGMRFFGLHAPIPIHCRSRKLTTDNVFDLLAGFTSGESESTGYQRGFPLAALDDYREFLHEVFETDISEDEHDRLARVSPSLRDFRRFAVAINRAEELGTRVLID